MIQAFGTMYEAQDQDENKLWLDYQGWFIVLKSNKRHPYTGRPKLSNTLYFGPCKTEEDFNTILRMQEIEIHPLKVKNDEN